MKLRKVQWQVEVEDPETPGFPEIRTFKTWSTAWYFLENNPRAIRIQKVQFRG